MEGRKGQSVLPSACPAPMLGMLRTSRDGQGGGLCAGTWRPWAQGTPKGERVPGGRSCSCSCWQGSRRGARTSPKPQQGPNKNLAFQLLQLGVLLLLRPLPALHPGLRGTLKGRGWPARWSPGSSPAWLPVQAEASGPPSLRCIQRPGQRASPRTLSTQAYKGSQGQ